MTKTELIEALQPFHDDDVVTLSDGNGWANIEDIKQDGDAIVLTCEEYPVFSEN